MYSNFLFINVKQKHGYNLPTSIGTSSIVARSDAHIARGGDWQRRQIGTLCSKHCRGLIKNNKNAKYVRQETSVTTPS